MMPPVFLPAYAMVASFALYGKGDLFWPLLMLFPVVIFKFLVFPFFVPFILWWTVYMLVKLPMEGKALFVIFCGFLNFGVQAHTLGLVTGILCCCEGVVLIVLYLKYPHLFPK